MYRIWKAWPFKNTTLLAISLVAFVFLLKDPRVYEIIRSVGGLGYLGAFIVGIMFVSTFTIAPAGIILYDLAATHNPLVTALFAGLGSMCGDYVIFRLYKDKVFDELRPIFSQIGGKYVRPLFKTPAFAWMLPVIGAIIIASPMPDEIGIGMLGLSKLKPWQFMLVAFSLNAIGIFIIVLAARA